MECESEEKEGECGAAIDGLWKWREEVKAKKKATNPSPLNVSNLWYGFYSV